MAEWHALAKLRLHTDTTLSAMDNATSQLGDIMRKFKAVTCAAFKTRELPGEARTRDRRKAKESASSSKSAASPKENGVTTESQQSKSKPRTKKFKVFNLNTYKFHSLPDYTGFIRWLGTTDGYSTQTVSDMQIRSTQFTYMASRASYSIVEPKSYILA